MWPGCDWNRLPPAEIPNFPGARYLPQARRCRWPLSAPARHQEESRTGRGWNDSAHLVSPLHGAGLPSARPAVVLGPAPVYSFILALLEGGNDQISIFFFNEMLLLEAAQASLVIAMSGPQGAWGRGARLGWHLQASVPSLPVHGGQVEPFLNPEPASTSPGAPWPPPTCPPSLPACVPTCGAGPLTASARASSGHGGCSLSDWTLGLGVG